MSQEDVVDLTALVKFVVLLVLASAELAVDFNGQYSFKTYKEEPNKIWIKDEGLNSTVKTLTRLQFILQEKIVDDAKRNYKSEYLPESVPPQISAAINRV